MSLCLSPTTTDDEMFADTFKITETDDGIFYEVEGKVSGKMCTANLLAQLHVFVVLPETFALLSHFRTFPVYCGL